MLTCKDASRLLSQSMDQPLPRLKRMELRVHVWLCSACSNFEKQLVFLRKAARRLDEECSATDQARLTREARERIRKSLHPQS